MESDRARWDDRYRDRPLADAKAPEALDLIVDSATVMPPPGRALDVACGLGSQSIWLADQGFTVVALDVSPVAVDATKATATSHRVGDLVDARVHDLDDDLPPELTGLDVVVCQRFRNRERYRDLVDVLRPGGLGMLTVLSSVGLEGTPGEFHARPGELLDAFDAFDAEIVASRESRGVASIVFRRR